MYVVGDKVVHPMHGAGVIDRIVTEKVDGVSREYYVFKMPMNGLVLKIPTKNADQIGIRPVDDRARIDVILIELPQLQFTMSSNWNQRYRENMAFLRSGDVMKVAGVIKGLIGRDHRRGLSTGEQKMLHTAKQILISEISLVEEMEYTDVEQHMEAALRKMEI